MNPDESRPIIKEILYAGAKKIAFREGTKVHFHFQTRILNNDNTLLDDSKKLGQGKPVELLIGKKFKLEVWESILRGMALNEVSRFRVHKSLVLEYPFVSKVLRDSHKPKEERSNTHCCAMTLQTEGIGYNDLNNLIKQPENLEFIMEIVEVEQPEQYEKETWQLTENELLELVPKLKEQGNDHYKLKKFKEASELYAKAIGVLEQLMVKEKPHDDDWNKLNEQKMLLLLNYSQCLLNIGDYYGTIEHCTTVLNCKKDNVKALYRRGKAHVGAWNPEKAKSDFLKVIELDPSMETVVKKELANLEHLMKGKNLADKEKMKKLFM
ncbi:AH receptor-interacting protein [Coccinella septempunctata]|uniref:AH receptor-interacting protein n=1 Tax=Coccinella septempunctata TaxID=41139 RepID=UPI001D09715F|nr:AH receptor-interacting protein [Coccinella septempunctata]